MKYKTQNICYKGKNNPNYKHGKPKCIDCGKKITYGHQRCKTCVGKLRIGKISHSYKNGKWLKAHCIDCSVKINPGCKRCQKCENKARWGREEFRDKCVQAIIKGLNLSPNKPEKQLNKLLSKLLPKQYTFVGDGKLIINGFCPDFVNKGNNKIIEMFGNYWHTIKGAKEKDKKRLKTYKKYGYKILIIWEHELKKLDKVKKKILIFN